MAHILIAEDDESMLNFLVLALGRAGHTVVAKTDGQEALEEINTHKNFDLLLTDVVMPGLDGIELSKKASEIIPNLKIMFITGFAAIALQKNDLSAVKEKMMTKPFHLNDLVDQVETLLNTDIQANP